MNFKEKEKRGGENYFFPREWKGYALNVLNKFGTNHNWLGMSNGPEEWPAFFHGTK